MQGLSKSILETIAYYDVLNYPMTSFEVWKYLISSDGSDEDEQPVSLLDVIKELDKDELKKNIERHDGFYFLKGRKALTDERIRRNKIAEEKFGIIRRVAWFLRFVPFVRMVAVTGRMAMKNAENKSDLDLLIVLEKGRIFTGRTLVTGLVQVLGKRRHGEKTADRICLNYFITTSSREITLKDLFSSSEYFFMLPMFGRDEFRKFQEANSWIREHRPNFGVSRVMNPKMVEDSFWSVLLRKTGEAVFGFDFIERYFESWQTERIKKDPRTNRKGSMVMADGNALIFLPRPQGPKVFSAFRKRVEEILNK